METGIRAQSATVHSGNLTFSLVLDAHIPLITGEAYVYIVRGSDGKRYAIKVYHGLNPLYTYDQALVATTQQRLQMYPIKLTEYPVVLPYNVICPLGVVYDESGQPVGYYMRFIDGCRKLSDLLATSTRRMEDINPNFIMLVMRNVHNLIEGVHAAGAVICDLKPSNILVDPSGEVFLIDTDSMRFGPYLSTAYTVGYVDPRQLHAQKEGQSVRLRMLPSQRTDWYAFAVMVCRAFLQAMPYEGVAINKATGNQPYTATERYALRLTLLSRGVTYPPLATPRNRVPLFVLNYLAQVFERDGRGECPIALLYVTWKKCTKLLNGVQHGWHARSECPECTGAEAPRAMTHEEQREYEKRTALPTLSVQQIPVGERIITATCTRGLLRLVLQTRTGVLTDANCRQYFWVSGAIQRCVLSGRRLAIVADGVLRIGTPASCKERITDLFKSSQPPVAANSHYVFYYSKTHELTAVGANDGSSSGTLPTRQKVALWAGEEVGFALVRTGEIARGLIFNALGQPYVINEAPCTQLYGHVNAMQCYFGDNRVWFLALVRREHSLFMYMLATNNSGDVLYEQMMPANDYLGSVTGHCAFGDRLLLGGGVHFLEIACDDTGKISRIEKHEFVLARAQPGQAVLHVIGRRFFAVHNNIVTTFKL